MDSSFILAIDVGKGTEDILLIKEQNIEDLNNVSNTIQLVLPSTAQIMKNRLNQIKLSEKLLLMGNIALPLV